MRLVIAKKSKSKKNGDSPKGKKSEKKSDEKKKKKGKGKEKSEKSEPVEEKKEEDTPEKESAWWSGLSELQQMDYLMKHPGSLKHKSGLGKALAEMSDDDKAKITEELKSLSENAESTAEKLMDGFDPSEKDLASLQADLNEAKKALKHYKKTNSGKSKKHALKNLIKAAGKVLIMAGAATLVLGAASSGNPVAAITTIMLLRDGKRSFDGIIDSFKDSSGSVSDFAKNMQDGIAQGLSKKESLVGSIAKI